VVVEGRVAALVEFFGMVRQRYNPAVVFAVTSFLGASVVAAKPIDLAVAKQYFAEAAALCEKDAGKLWGVSLCGPMIFVDSESRGVVANQADANGHLKADAGVFAGVLPQDVRIANTATVWADVYWTMVMWPLPQNKRDRAQMMMHELWHRVQSDVGMPMNDPPNVHLDRFDGRAYMQLEWRALAVALDTAGVKQVEAVKDALVFRAARRSIIKDCSTAENALELNEGLAEYTGIRLSGCEGSECIKQAIKKLDNAPKMESFVRSFAYASGPAWCFLLDQSSPGWRSRLKPGDDLAGLVARAMKVRFTEPLGEAYKKAGPRHGADDIREAETKRAKDRVAKLAAMKAKFVDGPVLTFPLKQVRFSFDPATVIPLTDERLLHPEGTISDRWGTLQAPGGFTIDIEMTQVVVPVAPNLTEPKTEGEGWSVSLRRGWVIVRDEKEGCWIAKQGG
jgi:hypothetical protein